MLMYLCMGIVSMLKMLVFFSKKELLQLKTESTINYTCIVNITSDSF